MTQAKTICLPTLKGGDIMKLSKIYILTLIIRKICTTAVINLKYRTYWFYHTVMHQNDAYGMINSVEPDQITLSAV